MSFIHVRLTQNHMATTFDLVVACEKERLTAARNTLEDAHRLIHQLEEELSEYLPESPIYQLNHAAPRNWVTLTPAARWLLEESFEIEKLSKGAFSCMAKSGPRSQRKVTVSEEGLACREDEDTHVGFGAIGKGYALDQVRRVLEQNGFENYCLNAGGSSLCFSGFSNLETPWSWGWSWSSKESETKGLALKHDSGVRVAVGVSGTQEKGGHILNRDGKSAGAMESALVAHPSAARADALSTALFVGGWDEARENFVALVEPPAMAVIEKNQTPLWNGIFQSLWGGLATALISLSAFADEEADVDLEALGMDDFTPYLIERSDWWILLPVIMLVFIAIHLKDSRPRLRRRITPTEDK